MQHAPENYKVCVMCVHITYLLFTLQDIALVSAGNVLYKSGYISDAIVCFSLSMEVCIFCIVHFCAFYILCID